MPYLCEKINLSVKQDRRIKLTQSQKEEIYDLYHNQNDDGRYSWNILASMYGVSKKTIGNIVNIEMGNNSKEHSKEYMKSYIISKEKRNEYMTGHRKYKYGLYCKGELK